MKKRIMNDEIVCKLCNNENWMHYSYDGYNGMMVKVDFMKRLKKKTTNVCGKSKEL